MIYKVIFGGFLCMGITARLSVPIIRKIYGWEDTSSKEYKEKEIRDWLDSKSELPVKPNSNGENWF